VGRRWSGSGAHGASEPAQATQRLITIVFAALVLATAGGLILAQRLKHSPTAVQSFRVSPSFDPVGGGARTLEQISFKTAHHGMLTVTVVDSAGNATATLAHDLRWPAYRTLCLAWNGRRGTGHLELVDGAPVTSPLGRCREAPIIAPPSGAMAAPGEYRVRVEVHGHAPAVLSPTAFLLTREARSRR
jgi:hypothetical protein